MKSIVRLAVIMLALIPALSFAQTAKPAPWPELKAFHELMSKSFHPVEEGNYAPLKANADSLLIAAKAWKASTIPADYKPEETKATLDKLVKELNVLAGAVRAKAADEKLKVLITDAHDIFHKIVGECKKDN
ncbi:hypothetical protein BH11BAC4_BH11BAC4_23420 [soil metagenome]